MIYWVGLMLFILGGSLASKAVKAAGFDQKLTLQGVSFHVTSANKGSVNHVRIVPTGKIARRTPVIKEVFGTVAGAEVADLDANGFPEIYVYVASAGSGAHGTLVGYAVNRGKSLTEITLPELMDDPVVAKGYMGHDEFAVMEKTLARRFPLYRDGDSNAVPTGGKRQLHYRLSAGEAGWLLRLDATQTRDF